MTDKFRKLRLQQVQKKLSPFMKISLLVPQKGWINTIRQALGLSSRSLAKKLNCSQSNIITMESREKKKTISLETLEQAAQAMNCKLFYCFVPLEPLDQIIENQARLIAKKRIKLINHSMKLEQQGLNNQQLKQQEDDLVEELLQGNMKNLWE